MNCLQYCLLQWIYLSDFRLWYNSNHVVIIEPEIDLRDKGYLPMSAFGWHYFVSAFNLQDYYKNLLREYLKTEQSKLPTHAKRWDGL